MSEPFLAEIRILSFEQAPKGWAQCNGQLLPINQNQALFALLGTNYGGNGQTTFALPDLRGRAPLHHGGAFSTVGIKVGEDAHTVTVNEMPSHTHVVRATNSNATTNTPSASVGYARSGSQAYGPAANLAAMASGSATNVGGSQPHENRQPFLALNFCIALQGIFPSQSG